MASMEGVAFLAQLRAHARYDELLASAQGGTVAEGLSMLRRHDPKFLRKVQSHRALFVEEMHGFLAEARRSEVARQLGVAPVAVEQPAMVGPTRGQPAPRNNPAAVAVAAAPSLADVMAEQLAEHSEEPPAPRAAAPAPADEAPLADAVPGGYDLRCKVSIGPPDLVGKVLGSSRAHINALVADGGVDIRNWSDQLGLDARESMTHLWVEGTMDEHEVQYTVRRLEDHIALTIERNYGGAASAAFSAAREAARSQALFADHVRTTSPAVSAPVPTDSSEFPPLAPAPAPVAVEPAAAEEAWPDLPAATPAATAVVDAALYESSSDDEVGAAEEGGPSQPEPEPAEDTGPAPWEIETARIRAEQDARRLAEEDTVAAAAAVGGGDEEAEGSDDDDAPGSDDEAIDALLEAAQTMAADLRSELTDQFNKGTLNRKFLRVRVSDARYSGKKPKHLDEDIEFARNDGQALIKMVIVEEVMNFFETKLKEDQAEDSFVPASVKFAGRSRHDKALSGNGRSGYSVLQDSEKRGPVDTADFTRRGTFMKKKDRKVVKDAATDVASARVVGETIAQRVMAGEVQSGGGQGGGGGGGADDSRWKRRLRMNKNKFA